MIVAIAIHELRVIVTLNSCTNGGRNRCCVVGHVRLLLAMVIECFDQIIADNAGIWACI